jgi:hypothetical protein
VQTIAFANVVEYESWADAVITKFEGVARLPALG